MNIEALTNDNVAIRLGVGAEKVFVALTEKSDILDSYILPCYDVLHTQGKDYIVDDILDVMAQRGVEV